MKTFLIVLLFTFLTQGNFFDRKVSGLIWYFLGWALKCQFCGDFDKSPREQCKNEADEGESHECPKGNACQLISDGFQTIRGCVNEEEITEDTCQFFGRLENEYRMYCYCTSDNCNTNSGCDCRPTGDQVPQDNIRGR